MKLKPINTGKWLTHNAMQLSKIRIECNILFAMFEINRFSNNSHNSHKSHKRHEAMLESTLSLADIMPKAQRSYDKNRAPKIVGQPTVAYFHVTGTNISCFFHFV